MRSLPQIMGILNVTPDSFSDGGEFNTLARATQRAKQMIAEGVEIIDIGGESTGPNAPDVSLEEEMERTIPIIKAIREFSEIPISIDSYKSPVVEAAIAAGANIINDVSALRADPQMAETAAKAKCPIILMYSKDNSPRTTIQKKEYPDIIETISDFFNERIAYAEAQGIRRENIILDPGMGQFISAIPAYSYEIITRLAELKKFQLQTLIGISRKSFLGGKMDQRDEKGLPITAIAYLNGASIIRTHNVKATKEFLCQLWN